jgi:hypothetical protein
MQRLLDSIKKTVYNKYLHSTAQKIVLTETHPDANCRVISFNKTGNALVYKFDKAVKDNHNNVLNEPLLIFEETSPIRSKCDYIIFYKYFNNKKKEEVLYVLICNMKSGTKGNMEDQMKSGNILSDFILQTSIRCQNSWNSTTKNYIELEYSTLKNENIVFKEVAIYHKLPIEKGGSKPQRNQSKRRNLECNKEYNLDQVIS